MTILDYWRGFFGSLPSLTSLGEFGSILEYAVCALVSILVIVLFFRLIIGVINAVFR